MDILLTRLAFFTLDEGDPSFCMGVGWDMFVYDNLITWMLNWMITWMLNWILAYHSFIHVENIVEVEIIELSVLGLVVMVMVMVLELKEQIEASISSRAPIPIFTQI